MDKTDALKSVLGSEWREHPDAPGYFFSIEGYAARVTVRKGLPMVSLLKGCSSGIGYRAISHPIGGGRYGRIYIHRAVCLLFNGPPQDHDMCVRHLDCDMHNNRAANLAWGTARDNALDGIRNGRIKVGEENHASKLTRQDAAAMREIRQMSGLTYKELGALFGVARMTACRVINGDTWK
jgi:hypothetical protein